MACGRVCGGSRSQSSTLCIEWAKTRALGLRNSEEVSLLEEEMRRIPVYLRWRAEWWESLKMHDEQHFPDAGIMRVVAEHFVTIPPLIKTGRAEVTAADNARAAELAEESDESEDEGEGDDEEGDGDDEEEEDGDENDGADEMDSD
ncbi:hypothetical protein C8J57DRAFT_1520894 [Mycena rebaudengoi]|nr:hypothetical protein C8J57DRAFT_1520894 [Mycena rebaudengoi]